MCEAHGWAIAASMSSQACMPSWPLHRMIQFNDPLGLQSEHQLAVQCSDRYRTLLPRRPGLLLQTKGSQQHQRANPSYPQMCSTLCCLKTQFGLHCILLMSLAVARNRHSVSFLRPLVLAERHCAECDRPTGHSPR